MAVTSQRVSTITFGGDVIASDSRAAANNANSPAEMDVTNLAAGANTINAPGGGTVATALTIIPPSGNTLLITLKGVAGDTGIPLHKTDPTIVALDSSFVSLVLNAAAIINGVRLLWS